MQTLGEDDDDLDPRLDWRDELGAGEPRMTWGRCGLQAVAPARWICDGCGPPHRVRRAGAGPGDGVPARPWRVGAQLRLGRPPAGGGPPGAGTETCWATAGPSPRRRTRRPSTDRPADAGPTVDARGRAPRHPRRPAPWVPLWRYSTVLRQPETVESLVLLDPPVPNVTRWSRDPRVTTSSRFCGCPGSLHLWLGRSPACPRRRVARQLADATPHADRIPATVVDATVEETKVTRSDDGGRAASVPSSAPSSRW